MTGRLGMVGSSLRRGDKEVGKALSMPKKIAAGAGIAAGVGGLGYSVSPSGRRMQRKAKVLNSARRAPGWNDMPREKQNAFLDAYVDGRIRKGLTPEEIQERIAASQARKRTPNEVKLRQAINTAVKQSDPGPAKKTKVPIKLLMPTGKQYGNWALDAAMVAGGATALHRSRKGRVGKADNTKRNTVAGAVVGAGATDGALNVGGWVNRETIKHHERKVDAGILPHPTSRNQRKNTLSAHRAKHGVQGDIHDAGNAYYRDFPKGMPAWKRKRLVGFKNHPAMVAGTLAAGSLAGAAIARSQTKVTKAETTMSDAAAHKLAGKYDTRGPLPKGLDRETKMKAYEARYIASGGKKGEKWKRRADAAEVGRNIGLAGATATGAVLLASRGKTGGKLVAKVPRLTPHRLEGAALTSAVGGGASELYGSYSRKRRASYANSPAGIAGSALTRMRAYTPGAKP